MLPIAHSLTEVGIPIGTVIAFVIGGAGISIPNRIPSNARSNGGCSRSTRRRRDDRDHGFGVSFNTVLAGLL